MSAKDLLHDAAGTPRRTLDVGAITRTARQRQRRRRALSVGAVVSVVAIAGTTAVVVVGSSDNGPEISVAQQPTPVLNDAGVGVTLPDGWRELPLVDREEPPNEILAVGTADRPPGGVIGACGAVAGAAPLSDRAAYLQLYEYTPGSTFYANPDGHSFYPPDAFVGRPADFASAEQPVRSDCAADQVGAATLERRTFQRGDPSNPPTIPDPGIPTTTLPPDTPLTSAPAIALDHFREIPFTDHGRLLLARIVTIDDVDRSLLDQAYGVLNSLAVEGATPTTSAPAVVGGTLPATTIPTTTAAPSPEEAALREAILDALNAAYTNTGPVPQEESVEGGFPLDGAQREDARTVPTNAAVVGRIVVQLNSARLDSDTRATINFDLLVDGNPITANTTGYVIFDGSHWRLGRATFCEILHRGLPEMACPRCVSQPRIRR